MFERYTEPAKRAIFFARAITLLNGAPTIDSGDLLCGLMWDATFRAQTLFRLHEFFPVHRGAPYRFGDYKAVHQSEGPPLSNDCKRILARTPLEADILGDYWIDTEHLLLGTLAEKNSLAAQQLAKAGITFGSAQRTVVANKSSRPEYGRVPMWWAARSAVELWMLKWMGRIKSFTRSG